MGLLLSAEHGGREGRAGRGAGLTLNAEHMHQALGFPALPAVQKRTVEESLEMQITQGRQRLGRAHLDRMPWWPYKHVMSADALLGCRWNCTCRAHRQAL